MLIYLFIAISSGEKTDTRSRSPWCCEKGTHMNSPPAVLFHLAPLEALVGCSPTGYSPDTPPPKMGRGGQGALAPLTLFAQPLLQFRAVSCNKEREEVLVPLTARARGKGGTEHLFLRMPGHSLLCSWVNAAIHSP